MLKVNQKGFICETNEQNASRTQFCDLYSHSHYTVHITTISNISTKNILQSVRCIKDFLKRYIFMP